jgi:hypothetical protein
VNGETDLDTELDAEALALLEALRAEEDIPPDVHDRVWARLDADVARGPARSIGGWAVAGLAIAAALALVWVGGKTLAREAPGTSSMQAPFEAIDATGEQPTVNRPRLSPRDELADVELPTPDPASSIDDAAETTTPRDDAEDGESVASKTPSVRVPRARKAPAATTDASEDTETDPLSEEMALLKQAKLALSRGQARQALHFLDEHANRFARGMLVQERQALRVVALCDAGELDRGREAAAVFLREHPRAALGERVRAACPE